MKNTTKIITWFFGYRVLLGLISLIGLIFLGKIDINNLFFLSQIRNFVQWDSAFYLDIAQLGYVQSAIIRGGNDLFVNAFFPLYPLFIRGIVGILDFFHIDGRIVYISVSVVISTLFALGTTILIGKFTNYNKYSLLLFFCFPTTFFLFSAYTESIFIFLILSSLYAYKKENYWLAGIAGFFASMTRLNGVLLLPIFFIGEFLKYKSNKKIDKKSIFLGVIPLGFILYLCYCYSISGDFFLPFTVWRDYWGRSSGFIGLFKAISEPFGYIHSYGFTTCSYSQLGITHCSARYLLDVFIIILIIYSSWSLWIAKGKEMLPVIMFSILNIISPLSSGIFDSISRYALSSIVLFLAFPYLRIGKLYKNFILITFSLIQIYYFFLFIQGKWVA